MQSSKNLVIEPIGLELESLSRPIHFPDLFGNNHPVELEIGIGKGAFLTGTAAAHPETNFFGLEYARWFWRYASDRLRRNNCLNARTARAEAAYFIREFIADATLSVVHIYFPDPWPKKRHNKRRLIQPPFLLEITRILKPNGRLQIKTDHQDYFNQIQQVVKDSPLKQIDYLPGNIGTNFERKYLKEGRKFFALAAERPQPT